MTESPLDVLRALRREFNYDGKLVFHPQPVAYWRERIDAVIAAAEDEGDDE